MEQEKIKDKLGREFFRYVLPSMLAFALSGIYSIADGFFVGNELGDSALTAINVAYPLTAFIQAAGTGIGMGGAILFTLASASSAPEARNSERRLFCLRFPACFSPRSSFLHRRRSCGCSERRKISLLLPKNSDR